MSDNDKPAEATATTNSTQSERPTSRKPYEPPRILSREPLEAMAATCPGGSVSRGKPNTSVCGVARS